MSLREQLFEWFPRRNRAPTTRLARGITSFPTPTPVSRACAAANPARRAVGTAGRTAEAGVIQEFPVQRADAPRRNDFHSDRTALGDHVLLSSGELGGLPRRPPRLGGSLVRR